MTTPDPHPVQESSGYIFLNKRRSDGTDPIDAQNIIWRKHCIIISIQEFSNFDLMDFEKIKWISCHVKLYFELKSKQLVEKIKHDHWKVPSGPPDFKFIIYEFIKTKRCKKVFHFHKNLLTKISERLKSIVNQCKNGEFKFELEVEENPRIGFISSSAINDFHQFIYGDGINLEVSSGLMEFSELFRIAPIYSVLTVTARNCFLHQTQEYDFINDDHVLEILEMAYYLNDVELFEAGIKYIKRHFQYFKQSEMWNFFVNENSECFKKVVEYLMSN